MSGKLAVTIALTGDTTQCHHMQDTPCGVEALTTIGASKTPQNTRITSRNYDRAVARRVIDEFGKESSSSWKRARISLMRPFTSIPGILLIFFMICNFFKGLEIGEKA